MELTEKPLPTKKHLQQPLSAKRVPANKSGKPGKHSQPVMASKPVIVDEGLLTETSLNPVPVAEWVDTIAEVRQIPNQENNEADEYLSAIILTQEDKAAFRLHNNEPQSTSSPFILANTIEGSLQEIKESHIIPVFIKDNEPVISHVDFIDVAETVVREIYTGEHILQPSIRLSHPIKGRIPEAKNKPAALLSENEKTLYYERMAFVIELPSVSDTIDGNQLSLCIGGVKAYNLDNLYNRKGADEHFKIFIGFKNCVCTNLSITTDGFKSHVSVRSIGELKSAVRILIENYNSNIHLHALKQLSKYSLTEEQFAKLIGRCRMYPYLPKQMQAELPQLLFNDTQIGTVVKDYYKDESFCKMYDGNINLWRLYNLFTGTNKSSYIDNFLDRNVNAFSFIYAIKMALDEGNLNWFLR